MAINVGTRLPEAELMWVGAKGPEPVPLAPLLARRRVVVFGLPGAFTGTCSNKHVPSFIRTKDGFAEKGITRIICVSVNDPYVMAAWGEATGATAAGLTFLADPECRFTQSIGMRFDAPAAGLIARCTRFAAIADDGVITVLHREEKRGVCDMTSGETLLALA